jgi:hypothetical protein
VGENQYAPTGTGLDIDTCKKANTDCWLAGVMIG